MKNKTDLRPLKTVNLDDAIRSWESLYGIDHADLDRPAAQDSGKSLSFSPCF